MKKILVVIDMQNDFIDGPLGTPEARAIVPRVCEKIREGEWDYIYYTLDTHSSNNYSETQEGRKLPIKHCIRDTPGWMLNKDIMVTIANNVPYEKIVKYTFGSARLIGAIEYLVEYWYRCSQSETEITLVGVCTDICVISNALLLKAHYPEARIVVDASCCAGTTPEMHEKALDVMRSCQIDIVGED